MRGAGAVESAPGATRSPSRTPLRLKTLSSEAEFAGLAGSWDDLVLAMPRPSPFLLHTWLLEWWRHYGGDGELAVHVAYRGDRLVGALPLCIRRRYGLRVTEFVGGTWAILADVLLASDEDLSAAIALVGIAATSGHDFADLFGLPGSSRVVAALPPETLRLVERLEAPVLDLGPGWDAVYRAKLSAKARSERRRRLRQLAKLGTVDASVARSREEIEVALEDAFRVHAMRWAGRPDPTGFVTPAGLDFHRAALQCLADKDIPRITIVRVDGRPIAFALAFHLQGRAYGVNMAFDPEFARFAPGLEAKLVSFEAAAAEGVTRVELLGAAAPHKRRFTDWFDPVYEGIGLARTLRGWAAAGMLADGIWLRRRIKTSKAAQRLYSRAPRHARA